MITACYKTVRSPGPVFFSGNATNGRPKHPSGLIQLHTCGTWGTSEDEAKMMLVVIALLYIIETIVSDQEISRLLPASMKELQAK